MNRLSMQRRRNRRGVVSGLALLGSILALTVGDAQSLDGQETTLSVRRALERLPSYGVFDFLAFRVDQGTVTLMGYTYGGTLKREAEAAARRVAGVDEVANRLEELPLSGNDDRIRRATFVNIYTDAFLSRYVAGGAMRARADAVEFGRFPGMQPFAAYPIHIIVKNARTLLFGFVETRADRQIAELKAREISGVFGVDNELVVNKRRPRRRPSM